MREKSNNTTIFVGVLVVLALVSLGLMLGGGMIGGGGMMSGYDGGMVWNQGSLWMVVVGSILMVIFLVVVIFGVMTLMRQNSNRSASNGETNLALLQQRFASGELTKEEYEKARQTLEV